MIKVILAATVLLTAVACGSKNSIAGTYEDKNWKTGNRIDTWTFTDKEWSNQTRFTNRPHPSSVVKGTYVMTDKNISLTYQHFISYKSDGTVRADRVPERLITETVSFSRDGDNLVIDAENKSIAGKRVLTSVK